MNAKILTFSSHGDTTLLEYDPATADMEEVNSTSDFAQDCWRRVGLFGMLRTMLHEWRLFWKRSAKSPRAKETLI